jgi:hypothetical protein
VTPLALELLEDAYGKLWFAGPEEFQHFHSPEGAVRWLRALLKEVTFFECSAVWPLSHMLAKSMQEDFKRRGRFNQKLAFLPAINTWIECEYPSTRDLVGARRDDFFTLTDEQMKAVKHTYRVAHILIGPDNSTTFAQRWQIGYGTPRAPGTPRKWRITRLATLPLTSSHMQPQRVTSYLDREGRTVQFDQPAVRIDDFVHYGFLSLINSPRIIGQRGHHPHERTARDVLKKLKLAGKFPPRAWTEIMLKVAPNPEDRSAGAPKETHLTGERCLHYCRTYLRVRHGQLEYIEGHWRGNPHLGVKQSRYKVEPENAS